jgi:hypothetical protein
VDRYSIPFDDVLKKIMLPVSFMNLMPLTWPKIIVPGDGPQLLGQRALQLATHFAYDPTFLAPYNTEYNTHYMNLLYAPQKH